jgi:hypothetical protein
MLNPTCTVFTCMLLFTKHNYRAKKINYLTLRELFNILPFFGCYNRYVFVASEQKRSVAFYFILFEGA